MKLSLNWLKDYIDYEKNPEELAHLLTMIGLEVESIENFGQNLDDILVAQILDIKTHPNADRLTICQVDTGKETLSVVCGAPNLIIGDIIPLALPGTTLPNGIIIKKSKIRGETSKGMLLAEDEIGLSDDHSGLMILSQDSPPGTPLNMALPIEDTVLDVNITPNRPDCASVLGIAREIAALTGVTLKRPFVNIVEKGPDINKLTSIRVLDPEACPRYTAGIINDIKFKKSPFWLRYRLFLSGIRSVNIIVDITNYVMLETGQPLHAFDYNRLQENRIEIRRAKKGELFQTLDGTEHDLHQETLMICDGKRAIAFAGIMGGLNSEIKADTKDILIESAFFDPITIRRASKRIGLSTEASYRFERGAEIEGPVIALKRAMAMIADLAGGNIAKGHIDNYPTPYHPPQIPLRINMANKILGLSLSGEEIKKYLSALEMDVRYKENDFIITPPSFRIDLSREIDLIEEVARLNGYDKIPTTYPTIRPLQNLENIFLSFRHRVKTIMMGCGFTEIITYSFTGSDYPDILDAESDSPLRAFTNILNPISIDHSVMRTSLLPGLIATIKNNISHGEKDLKLFEYGKIFIDQEKQKQPIEIPFLAGIMTGIYSPMSWHTMEREIDFFDIKGAIEALLNNLGLKDYYFKKGAEFPGYDPDFSSRIYFNDIFLGRIGKITSKVMDAYGLNQKNAYIFELEMETLHKQLPKAITYQSSSSFPAVYRDISIIVAKKIESSMIIKIIHQTGGALLESAKIFGLYEGNRIDMDEKAIAFRICYRSNTKTLDGNKVNQLHEAIIARIMTETGGRLKEG